MPDVLIHNCLVRLFRRDGWSWGPAPRELVDQIIAWLSSELTKQLGAICPKEEDVEITEPLRLSVRVQMNELGRLTLNEASAWTAPDGTPSTWPAPLLAARDRTPGQDDVAAAPVADAGRVDRQRDAVGGVGGATALARLLLAWRKAGWLGVMLRRLPRDTVAAFHRALQPRSSYSQTERDDQVDEPLLRAVREVRATFGAAAGDVEWIHLIRIVIAVELSVARHVEMDDLQLWDAIDRAIPLQPDGQENTSIARLRPRGTLLESPGALSRSEPAVRSSMVPRHADKAVRQTHAQPGSWEAPVTSVLPFLALGPLADAGFFVSLAASLEVADLTEAWPAVGAALAGKMLAEPDRHGRQTPAVRLSAAAFAGRPEPIAAHDLTDLAGWTRGKLAAADAVIAHELLANHAPGKPLAIHAVEPAAGGGWLLVEPDGNLLITWGATAEDLLDWLTAVESEILLVPRAVSAPAFLQELQGRGLRFLTDAPPTQGETMRQVRQGHDCWWTNDGVRPGADLARHGALLTETDANAGAVWNTVGTGGRAAPLAPHSDLDRTMTLAAAFALGQLARTLWHEREPTDPLLMLERFATLDGRVQFREDQVRVVLPLGRRSWDLAEHQLLDNVPDLPWLDGRVVTFHVG